MAELSSNALDNHSASRVRLTASLNLITPGAFLLFTGNLSIAAKTISFACSGFFSDVRKKLLTASLKVHVPA